MTLVKRLRVLTAVLTVAAAIAAASTTLFGDFRDGSRPSGSSDAATRPDGSRIVDELAASKFSKNPAITYQVRAGDILFAWQVKPTLAPAPNLPRDILIMVDTSASQAGKPLQQARQIIESLTATLTPNDRVSIWTVSTPAATRSLTRDFQSADSEDVRTAAAALTEVEYGSGASDLKSAFAKSLATIRPNRGRQQMVLMLGDGESAFNPVTETDRVALGGQMDQSDVYFFAVPLGVKVHPANLHGLTSLTGGAVVRVTEDLSNPVSRGEFAVRLKATMDVPVLKADKYSFGPEVAEVFPTKLPPLRADRATLVIGKLAKPAGAVTATVAGTVSNRQVNLNLSQNLPTPQPDNFFLNLMIDQWRSAPHKDEPAMLQADRALALASTQVELYRDQFLIQAVWAISMDKMDEAANQYGAARRIDPNNIEAASGLQLIEKIKSGAVDKGALLKRLATNAAANRDSKELAIRQVVQEAGAQPAPAAPVQAAPAASEALREASARRQVEEERYRVLVDATINKVRRQLRTDPDGAYQDLKRQRDEIAGYNGIGDSSRARLTSDLDAVMREIFVKGAEIKRQGAKEREQIARSVQRLNEFDRTQNDEDRTKAKIDAFRQLMQQARYELAYQEAQLMIQERISKGQSVPSAAVASYVIGQQATQLREWRELIRIRQDRYLLTMMQTEKSAIPYPDEPPVHFPPAAVWRELTGLRREAYESSNLGPAPSANQKRMKSALENEDVDFDQLDNTPLSEIINQISKRYNLTIIIDEAKFKAADNQGIKDKKPALGTVAIRGMKLGNFLDLVLYSMGVTYIVRPDYIEITTLQARLEEKVTRVFPVADLVIPIPSSVNQATLQQNLQIQNQTLAIFGQASLFGGGLQQLGGFGGIGGGAGFFQNGGGGGNVAGGAQNQGALFPRQQGNNQGFGGGFGGFGGGQLGQFGNLGGQFGIQGGDQSRLLMNLIYETVDKGFWANIPGTQQQPGDDDAPIGTARELNSLGYYPPSRALIVRGTGRYHSSATIKLKVPGDAMAANPQKRPDGVAVVKGPTAPGTKPAAGNNAVASNKPTIVDPKTDVAAMQKRLDKDPKRMWQQAVDWTVTDPGLIVASAEALMAAGEYGHAAEILKANLRKGLATDDWAHEALAIALQMSQADPIEVERAAVSAIDLDPVNPKGYLKAAKVEADLNHAELAVAFCRRAAECGPDQPQAYANALAYAEKDSNVKSDTVDWAAGNLLKRDWPADGVDYHTQARDRLTKFVARFESKGVKADVLRKTLAEETQRDLAIDLQWQGPADLDLVVAEPTGSVCKATQSRTTAGGVIKADPLGQTDDSRVVKYTAASAFPGTYVLTVKRVMGQPVGGTATIKVAKFKGTPQESHDLITIDLSDPKPVYITLEGGTRNELVTLVEDPESYRLDTPGAQASSRATGFSSGFGTAGSAMSTVVESTTGPAMPLVNAAVETRLPGVGGGADMRSTVQITPDRKSVSFNVKPVFAPSHGGSVPMPRVPMLPGGEDAK